MRNFIGREIYVERLEKVWKEGKTRILSFYGRRRVGKTELIRVFCKDKEHFYFEGLEDGDTETQIHHFLAQLAQWTGESHLKDLQYSDWFPVFDLLTQKIKNEKKFILVFDEFPWMAAGRSKLVSQVKYFWDKYWKYYPHLLLILCGSAASWMLKNVIRSNALYGRTSESFWVKPLEPFEVAEFIGSKRGQKEILEYLFCFGGVPRYLEEFNFNHSFELNVENTCFESSGFFVEEADKIFYSQFKEIRLYKQIVQMLLKKPLTLQELSDKLKMPSGGGLKAYLDNLTAAGIIEKILQIKSFKASKVGRYHVVDEFLRFHEAFIRPHLEEIRNSRLNHRFEKFTQGKWFAFLGLSFERFCVKNRYLIAQKLGIDRKVLACAPVLNNQEGGFQYDLVYLRSDGVINLCEVKYLTEAPSTFLIKEMENRMQKTSFPKGMSIEKILICNQEASNSLKESGYFHQILLAGEILKEY